METYMQMKLWRKREQARKLSAGDPRAEMIRALSRP